MRLSTLLIGILIGVGFTMALGAKPSADAGDWLAFTGALVGVVFTIAGTLWLEHHRSDADDRKRRKIVSATLLELSNALELAGLPRGDDPIDVARPERIESERALLKAFEKLAYARQFLPNQDLECWQAMEALTEAIERDRDTVEREVSLIVDAGNN